MPDQRSKTFTYFSVRYLPEPASYEFQAILEKTFEKTTVKDRIYKTDEDAPYFQFINQKSGMKGFFCASLYGFEQDAAEHIIAENFDKEYIEAKMIQAPSEDGTVNHFLDGKAYFICYKNHFILSGDSRIGSKAAEIYLNDRIRERHHGLPKEFRFTLERSIPQQTRKKISNVKSIQIRSMLPGDPKETQALEKSSKKITKTSRLSTVIEVIRELTGADIGTDEFSTRGIIEDNEIQVTLSLKWASRKHRDDVVSQLDDFANTFRHVGDELDVNIQAGSATYNNKDLKLSEKKTVKHHDDLPVFDDICDKMITWYEKLNAEKQI